VNARLGRLRSVRERAGLFLDFDGSLAEIVPHPELAIPVPGAVEVLRAATNRFALVGVVSGRRESEIRARLPVSGLRVFGIYGLEGNPTAAMSDRHRGEMKGIAQAVPGAWVEDKGLSLTLHYREAEDPDAAEAILRDPVRRLARREGLALVEGKRTLEIAPARIPGKGEVVVRVAWEAGLQGALYAGDDLADLDAFGALDDLSTEGMATVKVAVQSEETPREVTAAADLVVDRPAGLVELVRRLVS
jgi:trehalose 6-phosphate phosphatase